ncbi:hypothetical protein AAIH33_32050, partial [Pseudomonas aeruginosa]|uniref:hypothetical protein n=1 Tax=Pseudomonas aeruginosa TaxID=287 RepID=UPI0031B67F78
TIVQLPAAPETQRVMFFKNQDLFQAPAIHIYVFCQSSGWQVMRTQEQKEENTGERQMQIWKKQVRDLLNPRRRNRRNRFSRLH